MLATATSSPRVVRTSATPNAQHQTPSEITKSPRATAIEIASNALTPMAAGIAVTANSASPTHDETMIRSPRSAWRAAADISESVPAALRVPAKARQRIEIAARDRQQPGDLAVVRQLLDGARAGGSTQPRAQSVVAEQPLQGGAHRRKVVGIDDEPRLAVDDRFVRPAAATSDRPDAARRRFDEHNAESLGLETGPTLPAQHGKHVRAPVEGGKVGIRHPAEEGATPGNPPRGGAALQAAGVAAGAADGQLDLAVEAGKRVDEHLQPLSGRQTTEPEHQRPVRRQSQSASRRTSPRGSAPPETARRGPRRPA